MAQGPQSGDPSLDAHGTHRHKEVASETNPPPPMVPLSSVRANLRAGLTSWGS